MLFCIFILFSMVTFAFIIKETTISSIITFGSVKMKVIETTIENGIKKEVENGTNIDVTNNSYINRNIKIENIGNHEIYVRVSFDIEGKKNNIQFDTSSLINLNTENANWIYKDGWYYYKNSIKPNEITDDLKINIHFDIEKITNMYAGCNFNLYIDSEAVQYENNSENVLEAKGWASK